MTSELFAVGEAVDLLTVLQRREERVAVYAAIWRKIPTATVISLKLNLPGPIKNNHLILHCFDKLLLQAEKAAAEAGLTYQQMTDWRKAITGPELIWWAQGAASTWKQWAINLETATPAGRLLDIDVLTINGALSRKDLGIAPRRCFLCQQEAKVCARSRKHTVAAMQAQIDLICRRDGLFK